MRSAEVDAFVLWREVQRRGGGERVTAGRLWKALCRDLGLPEAWGNASALLRQAYVDTGMAALEQVGRQRPCVEVPSYAHRTHS